LTATSKVYPSREERTSEALLSFFSSISDAFYPGRCYALCCKRFVCIKKGLLGMQEVTFDLQTLTPLFLAGADQTAAELRAPSFRGLMRYWQRALVGGLVGTDRKGLEEVVKAETDVFGATDIGSAVQIRVSGTSGRLEEFKKESRGRDVTGRDYLLWSMARSGSIERGNYKPARWYFPQGTSFEITLSARGQDDTKLKKAIAHSGY